MNSIADFITGTNRWIQGIGWLKGGVHHATLLAILTMFSDPIPTAVVEGYTLDWAIMLMAGFLFLYLVELFRERSPDSFGDYLWPACYAVLWLTEGLAYSLPALAGAAAIRFLYWRWVE